MTKKANILPTLTETQKRRFFDKVSSTRQGQCWAWIGAKRRILGYGLMVVNGKRYSAHRLSYLLHYSHDPGDLFVCHHCDNRICVNPAHLFLGTTQDNIADRHIKGRDNVARGEEHYRTDLTAEIVTEIRTLYKNGLTQTEIAQRFKTGQSHIKDILIGRVWGHVPFDWDGDAYETRKRANRRRANEGTKNPAAKLTAEIVLEVRRLYTEGLTQQVIADKFNISQTHVGQLIRKVCWGHI